MDRAGRRLIFYAVFAAYVFYNFAWICGLSFSWNSLDTVATGWFIGLCFVGDLIPLGLIPYYPRLGGISFAAVLAAIIFLGIPVHELNRSTLLLWFAPKLLLVSLAIWMNRGKKVDYPG
jgi:hypothetical protein